MSPDNTHKLMGIYMESLILGVNAVYMLFCFFKLFPIGCRGLKKVFSLSLLLFLLLHIRYDQGGLQVSKAILGLSTLIVIHWQSLCPTELWLQ